MKTVAIIPARMQSSRFPNKPLADIDGMPMIVHVFKRTELCPVLSGVFVATDSSEIFDVVNSYGGKAIMTGSQHQTGSDRIAEACKALESDIVVNVQGDEPLLVPEHITNLVHALKNDQQAQAATLMCKTDEYGQVSECKIVTDLNNNIMYFSRDDIPSRLRVPHSNFLKLYNIVAFRKDFLLKFASWDLTPLERIEYIEYLRILEHGYRLKGVLVEAQIQSVDTPEELETVRERMKTDPIVSQYR